MSTLNRQIPRDAAGDTGTGGGGGGGDAAAQAAAAAAAKSSGGNGGDAAAQAAAAAAAKPKPFYEGLYGADGKLDKTAFDRLPDHLKPHKDWIGKYDTIEALITGGANAHALGVKKALTPLLGTEPPEVVAERKAHLDQINGVPKDAKGYGIARPDDIPEIFWHQEGMDELAALGLKHSVSPAMMKDVLALQNKVTQESIARGKQMEADFYAKQDSDFATAIQRLGIDGDKAADLVQRAAGTLKIDLKNPILKNAEVRLAMVRVTQMISEDKLITGEVARGETLGDELKQARDIIQNPANPLHKAYLDASDPRNEQAKSEVTRLYEAAFSRKQRGGL